MMQPETIMEQRLLTDGGLETDIIYNKHVDLPEFAAYTLLLDEPGIALLRSYYEEYLTIAAQYGYGFILQSPTWRANTDWGAKLGHDQAALDAVNRKAIVLMRSIADEWQAKVEPLYVSGCVGPRYDGYRPERSMRIEDAEAYHLPQVAAFAEAGADLVEAMTITSSDEALGIVKAAVRHDLPVVVSFTTEKDGRLPDGEILDNAIRKVDAMTDEKPVYYMVNCVHPSHISSTLAAGGDGIRRIKALRANASSRSHGELDEAADIDAGDPMALSQEYREFSERYGLKVLGGCCGTDSRHVAAIALACRS